MKRCERTPTLDNNTLELHCLCTGVEAVVQFLYAVLLRTVFSGFGLLSLFLSEYERLAGRTFRDAILQKRASVEIIAEIVG